MQGYEARLFRLNKGHDGGVITSAEEAVDLRKKMSALNRFYWTLSQPDKSSQPSSVNNEDEGKKRDVGEKVMVSIELRAGKMGGSGNGSCIWVTPKKFCKVFYYKMI